MPQNISETAEHNSDLLLASYTHPEHVVLEQSPSATALAGPGTTRQTRKLQLRRAGFKGKMVPQRNITPKSGPSDHWERRDASGSVDAALQMSVVSEEQESPALSSRKSGILQEISNSSFRKKKSGRPRIDVFQDEGMEDSPRTVHPSGSPYKDPLPEW